MIPTHPWDRSSEINTAKACCVIILKRFSNYMIWLRKAYKKKNKKIVVT
jgi:hypothetical protein